MNKQLPQFGNSQSLKPVGKPPQQVAGHLCYNVIQIFILREVRFFKSKQFCNFILLKMVKLFVILHVLMARAALCWRAVQ